MATGNKSNLCSICNKLPGIRFCFGCNKYFCPKDFREHEKQLAIKFDDEIIRSHDELLDQIQKLEKSNYLSLNLFAQIEQWKKTTINKVEKVAEKAHLELIKLIDEKRAEITEQLQLITKEIRSRREEEIFVENDIDQLKQEINKITQKLEKLIQNDKTQSIIVENNQIDWDRLIYIREIQDEHEIQGKQINLPLRASSIDIHPNAKWKQSGITVAGGNGRGSGINQLLEPRNLYVDDEQTIYIADCENHRIMEWKCGATNGNVVAGGNESGNGAHQLNRPDDVIIDKDRDSLIISDYGNQRVVRWPRRNDTSGEIVLSNTSCVGLTKDESGSLYVVDDGKHELRRYKSGDTQGTVIAGGNGEGNRLDQLYHPHYVFIDRDHSVYVSDCWNHRVMKWEEGAKQGIVVAGGQGQGNSLTQLSGPQGIVVDQLGTVYVADYHNHRIMRWPKGATQGSVIAGGNGKGAQSNQFDCPVGISFDRYGNLYVVEFGNNRVQKFNIE
ncbi:unnamed protein product [Rotaria sp. Silwood1]|nr:unnamed protein product [Rotaria sp. Silwood1]CAF1485900.1 unnamed protein product [Rotaria sp. Silwood1]CAF3662999.1 unnamed protein product [Rotaria sp. Silwood1]CAF4855479.1 unnamed protein product [Rotaria sp. Silwood1]